MAETKQIKSKKRVQDHGEVFTAKREVDAMIDLVKDEAERIDSRVLEPACGEGAFVTEILRRKLAQVRKLYKGEEYAAQSMLAVSSIYGVDIMRDNVRNCRCNLYKIWREEFIANCKRNPDRWLTQSVELILNKNIICGNTLSMKQVNDNATDLDAPIEIWEWSLSGKTMSIKRHKYEDLFNKEAKLTELSEDNPDHQCNFKEVYKYA